jgi:hypothetical protein
MIVQACAFMTDYGFGSTFEKFKSMEQKKLFLGKSYTCLGFSLSL